LTEQDLDTPIAELERYGMECRWLNKLDDNGFRTIRDLVGVTEAQLLAIPQVRESFVANLKSALRNFAAGTPTKTRWECMGITEADYRQAMLEIWKTGFAGDQREWHPPKDPNEKPQRWEIPIIQEADFRVHPLQDRDLL